MMNWRKTPACLVVNLIDVQSLVEERGFFLPEKSRLGINVR